MPTDSRIRPDIRGEGGFALALVVLFLFAILLMAGAGYQVISMEAFQSQKARETGQALAVARGGLDWFIGIQRGSVPDSTTFSINGGTALITTRKVATLSQEEDLFLVRSEGRYTDPSLPEMPAVRVVSQYAIFQKVPVNVMAPIMTTAGRTRVERNGAVFANDLAPAGSCTNATGATLGGVVGRNTLQILSGGQVVGAPQDLTLGPFATVVDSVDTRWDVYSDPTFPVDYDDQWPNFYSMPSDSFPVVRINGDFAPNWSRWGRGVLIVTGTLYINNWTWWSWSGIILAGDVANVGRYSFANIFGTLVAGQGDQMGNWDIEGGTFRYHSCYVERAGLALAHLTPVKNSWWEDTG